MATSRNAVLWGTLSLSLACSPGTGGGALDTFGTTTNAAGDTGSESTEGSIATAGASDGSGDETGDHRADVGGSLFDVGGGSEICVAGGVDGALVPCTDEAPPESFEPEVQWAWSGFESDVFVTATPLVANLTDDNGDGLVDLCDIPDIVVVAFANPNMARIYVLDGETGQMHWRFNTAVDGFVAPALGDIDSDGIPEIVASTPAGHAVVAFEPDGVVKWVSSTVEYNNHEGGIALADLDNDGDVEVMAGTRIVDHEGNDVALLEESYINHGYLYPSPTAADLDGDGDLEVILGHAAYHHDAELLWRVESGNGYPQVADLDGDALPEVLVTTVHGLAMIEHDGEVRFEGLTPTGDPAIDDHWIRPAAIHDFDGDGLPEFAMSSVNNYSLYEADGTLVWSVPVQDATGVAGGTAFDFLGDGTAEAMYADESSLFVYNEQGTALFQAPRTSWTSDEYPVVADVDNDGSAEIVVVSNRAVHGEPDGPAVQVIRDVQDRWVPARRIWNQHTYHVTNVNEDGTIPMFELPSWEHLNTFRTQAQIVGGGGVCFPPAG